MRNALLFALLVACAPLQAAEVAGVKVEEAVRVAGSDLRLNGAGLRGRAFIKVYVMGLYLAEKRSTAPEVLAVAGPKRILIHMLRDVDSASFSEAMEEGIRDNHSEAEVQLFAPRMKVLNSLMHDIKQASSGMSIELDWIPGTGTQVRFRGQPHGKPIPGEDFYRALLRIWLSDKPVSTDLKKALLGQGG
jgi:hypothetical protein